MIAVNWGGKVHFYSKSFDSFCSLRPVASPIQSSAAAAAAAFAHLNNTYLEASSQRNNYVSDIKHTECNCCALPNQLCLASLHLNACVVWFLFRPFSRNIVTMA